MALEGPAPMSFSPARALVGDWRAERAARVPFPPGETSFNLRRTERFASNPLALLLESYERYGPVFTLRLFHGNVIFMLGPEANHHILVSHAQDFAWREGHMRDLIALLGDGLLTIDGDFHRRSRQIMLPAFHRERIAETVADVTAEIERAIDGWREGGRIDLYAWTRRLALRVAMRSLFGVDPDGDTARQLDAARLFERALGFYARDYFLQILRGPLTPWARMHAARERLDWLIYSEIERRRRTGERSSDLLSLLLDARDEDGSALSDRHIRDEVMTLLFAGHDTTTSTVAFLFYELAHHPEVVQEIAAEQDDRLGESGPTPEQLTRPDLPVLEMAIEETLRMYPPAWIGPRRSLRDFEFQGTPVPANAFVNYSSWASHHLPDVFADPERFDPLRFSPAAKAQLPRGAYVPFGGGSRMCIGMRFGQMEVRAIASAILARFSLELDPGYELSIRQMPTISPRQGLPVTVRPRGQALHGPLTAAA